MAARSPFSSELLLALARTHGTPVFVYDAPTVRARCAELRASFDVVRYAQKANSNLALLALVRSMGCRVDAVSAGEVERALAAGFTPAEIVFTSDLLDRRALEVLARRGVAVNVGSADMLAQLAALDGFRSVTLRVNPGFGDGHAARVTTGGAESKHGIWHAELAAVATHARALGLEVDGLHLHVGSGASLEGLSAAANALRRLALEVGPSLRTISAGGGLPIPYRQHEARVDVAGLARTWRSVQRELEQRFEHALELEIEPGRYLVAEAGALLTEVRAVKRQGEHAFALVDAGFHNLPRPLLYGAYHEIRLLSDESRPRAPQIVAGPLCETSDVFTQDASGNLEPRLLPRLAPGDVLCIDDAGAYAASMASNYNGQPFAAEVLVDGERVRRITRLQALPELWTRDEAVDR